ncbi:MAG: DUF2834 domain-containing protein [Cyanobacteriota bacterium]|nr:DUF2834 domain-containing protein [Cyanobacteriota bacterium]
MVGKIGFGLLWVGLLAYAFLFAPPSQPDTFELISRMSRGDIEGINPLIVALFNLMGIWPMVYGGLLFADGRGQKIRAFPFAIASFLVGAFAILPYLILRSPNPTFSGAKNGFLKALDSRLLGILLALGAIALATWGLLQGNWPDFIAQWQTRRFIHVMSLDFCLLCLLFPTLVKDDLARRGVENSLPLQGLTFLPLLGPLLYLCLRPSLPDEEEQKVSDAAPTVEA